MDKIITSTDLVEALEKCQKALSDFTLDKLSEIEGLRVEYDTRRLLAEWKKQTTLREAQNRITQETILKKKEGIL